MVKGVLSPGWWFSYGFHDGFPMEADLDNDWLNPSVKRWWEVEWKDFWPNKLEVSTKMIFSLHAQQLRAYLWSSQWEEVESLQPGLHVLEGWGEHGSSISFLETLKHMLASSHGPYGKSVSPHFPRNSKAYAGKLTWTTWWVGKSMERVRRNGWQATMFLFAWELQKNRRIFWGCRREWVGGQRKWFCMPYFCGQQPWAVSLGDYFWPLPILNWSLNCRSLLRGVLLYSASLRVSQVFFPFFLLPHWGFPIWFVCKLVVPSSALFVLAHPLIKWKDLA